MQPRSDNTVAEGIATTTLEIIFPQDTHFAWTAGHLLPAAQITPDPPDLMQRIAQAGHNLRSVSANAAILYHTDQINREQALDYMVTYGLSPPKEPPKGLNSSPAPCSAATFSPTPTATT